MKTKRKSHNLAIIACVCVIFVFSTIGNAEPIIKENSGLKAIGPPPLPPTERNLSPNTNGFGQTISKNITAKPLNSRTTYTITLQEGWNYISVPYWLASGYDEAYDLFYDVDCGGRTIWEYDGLHGWMPVSATTKIKPLDGICIYSVESDTIDLNLDTNNRTATVKTLYSGYNLIGFMDPYLSPNDGTEFHSAYARNFLATLGDQWSQVFGWDTSTQAYETNWIFRGSGDPNSDFRKLYPNQGYMVLLSSNGTLTITNQPTYLASAEWVNTYYPYADNLTLSSTDANGFANEINNVGYWSLPQTGQNNKFFGDNTNPKPTGDHWTTVDDSNYMDSTNLAYFDGHGGPGGIAFGDGSEAGYSDIAWGDTLGYKQLAWVALGACSVLNNTGGQSNTHWDVVFQGLHGLVGWEGESYAVENYGYHFAHGLKDGRTVWNAWYNAMDLTYYGGSLGTRKVGVLAAQGTGWNCYDDHLYGYGTWVAPGDHITPGTYGHINIYRDYHQLPPP